MKFLKRIFIAAIASIATAAISISAYAGLTDQGSGGTFNSAQACSYAYGWSGYYDLTWMLDIYVAATDDGKIDTSRYSVTSNLADGNIEYIGTLPYTAGLPQNCIMLTKSYVSDRNNGINTTPVREMVNPYSSTSHYELPETTAYWNNDLPFLDTSKNTFTYVNAFGERTIYLNTHIDTK